MTNTEKTFAILRASFTDGKLSDEVKNSITEQDLAEIYKLSKKHDLAHIVGDILDKNGLLPEEFKGRKFFLQERNMAVFRYEQINYELQEILRLFNEIGVAHIPLKGSVIRKLYPEPWMRTSCDIDILVREEDLEACKKALTEVLGYRYEGRHSHDEQFFSPSDVHLELHYTLYETYLGKITADFLNEIWDYANPIEVNEKTFALTNEAFFVYHFAHMAKHFEAGGCGIKPFMDICVMERFLTPDEEKLTELLRDCGMEDFAREVRYLSKVWFEQKDYTTTAAHLEEFVLTGGVYGTTTNKVKAQQSKKGGRAKYLFMRIFQPYELLRHTYPILFKHKWLTPFCQVARWFRIVFKNGVKKPLTEFSASKNFSKQEQDQTQELLKNLGLM